MITNYILNPNPKPGKVMLHKTESLSFAKPLIDGVLTGCFSTALFNPVDRALYIMVRDKKPIMDPALWKTPYQGVTKALYGRIISYGVYLSFFDKYSDFFSQKVQHPLLFASLATSTSTVGLSQWVNVLKLYQWNHQVSLGMFRSTKQMVNAYGWRVFCRGLPQTLVRDFTFTSTYFFCMHKWNKEKKFAKNVVFASCATALTSPLNYFRNRVFFNFNEPHVPLKLVLHELSEEMKTKKTLWKKVGYIALERGNIGFGTLRVGVGMAVADKIYNYLKETSYL
jgi:hypothetical protein